MKKEKAPAVPAKGLTLLHQFLAATSPDQVRDILTTLGDSASADLDRPFGTQSLTWKPFGGTASNVSSIGLGTKPGRSLVERITNSIDALLEDRRPKTAKDLPSSAREAAAKWFGRPISDPTSGLFKWKHGDVDRAINLLVLPSGTPDAPTVDVLDAGTGIKPADFPNTILSLQAGNKITKWYLQGAFGQGGASTLAFSDYVLVVSRFRDMPDTVGFTIIRVLDLGAAFKEDAYAYLTDASGQVLTAELKGDLELYPKIKTAVDRKTPLPTLGNKGTLVRHYGYKLSNLEGPFLPVPGNLYHYLNFALFDPLFPFRVIDLRDTTRDRDEIVGGTRNRLMRLLSKEDREVGSQIQHHRPMEYVAPVGHPDPVIGIEYWVVFNWRKAGRGKTKKEKDAVILRPQSNELYLQTGHPIVGTMNGQVQGELTATILRDMGLTMLARHMVVHIDATRANARVRRELFATNREGFKEGPVLEGLKKTLTNILENDERLFELERELAERLVKAESAETTVEVKRAVAQLLRESGFKPTGLGPAMSRGEKGERSQSPEPGTGTGTGEGTSGESGESTVYKTLPFPQVKKWRIIRPEKDAPLEIPYGSNRTVIVETDADPEFDARGLVALRFDPDYLEIVSKTPLRNGRLQWRVRPRMDVPVASAGTVTATITTPDGKQLADTRSFAVQPPEEEKADKSRAKIPPFEIIPVSPSETETWMAVWPELDPGKVTVEELTGAAYRPMKIGDGVHVYYSTAFKHFDEELNSLKHKPVLLELFRQNYEIWVGFHGILQLTVKPDWVELLDPDMYEKMLEVDRSRVGRMEVKQVLELAELQQHQKRLQRAAGKGEE